MVSGQRVLLTGATGHVGGRLLRRLLSEPTFTVRTLIRSPRSMPTWSKRADVLFGNFEDPATRFQSLIDTDVVIHATRGFPADVEPTSEQIRVERMTTNSFVREAMNAGVRRFIFLSSIHVYGASLSGSVTEETTCKPHTTYGSSRRAIEEDVLQSTEHTNMEAVVVRLSNAFGAPGFPRDDVWSLVVHDFCRQAIRSKAIELRSDPRTSRDVIAMRDVTEVLVQFAARGKPLRGVFNLASGQTVQIQDLAALVGKCAKELFGIQIPVRSLRTDQAPPPTFTLDISKLRRHEIDVSDSRVPEINDLLAYSQDSFGASHL